VTRAPDASQRLLDVRALAERDGALPDLLAASEDPSPEVAMAALELLGRRGTPHEAAALRARLLDADPGLVPAIARALRALGDREAVTVCTRALDDPAVNRRLAAARALAVIADPSVADALRAATADPISGVRYAALQALARLGASPASAEACARALHDTSPAVRMAGLRALARVTGEPRGYIDDALITDPDTEVRRELARLTARLVPVHAASLLSDRAYRVRAVAARHAGRRARDRLVAMVIDDPAPKVRLEAARALAALADPVTLDALIAAQADSDALVRAAALRGLEGALSREQLVARLAEELSSSDAGRRVAALYALARLRAVEAEPHLRDLLADPDPAVRMALVGTAEALASRPRELMSELARDPSKAVRGAAESRLMRWD
jgi:HEAT repeat protein